MNMLSTLKKDQSQQNHAEAREFASWTKAQLVNFAHDSLKQISELEDQVSHMRQDLRSALQAYRAIVREQEAQKDVTSTT